MLEPFSTQEYGSRCEIHQFRFHISSEMPQKTISSALPLFRFISGAVYLG
jgi:hypothetical protein